MRTTYLVAVQVTFLAGAVCAGLGKNVFAQMPSSYGSYYTEQLKISGPSLGAQSSSRYLYDKYFYHNTAVSPYLNLGRPGTDAATSYQAFVRPEQERRQAAAVAGANYVQQRKLEGRVGDTRFPGAGFMGGTAGNAILKPVPSVKTTPSAYYNHWYGGWANR
jgi:hypothetical protein